MLIFQHFLICYFICPPELRKKKKHQTSFYFSPPDPGGKINRSGFYDVYALCSLSPFSFPSLCASSSYPTPASTNIFHLESDSWYLPWSQAGVGGEGEFPFSLKSTEILVPRTRLTPQTSGCHPRIFSPLPNLVSEVKWFLFWYEN